MVSPRPDGLHPVDIRGTRSLTENSHPYCEQSEFGHFLSCFSLNRTTIRLKTPQKTGSNQIALATGAILGQAPRHLSVNQTHAPELCVRNICTIGRMSLKQL